MSSNYIPKTFLLTLIMTINYREKNPQSLFFVLSQGRSNMNAISMDFIGRNLKKELLEQNISYCQFIDLAKAFEFVVLKSSK